MPALTPPNITIGIRNRRGEHCSPAARPEPVQGTATHPVNHNAGARSRSLRNEPYLWLYGALGICGTCRAHIQCNTNRRIPIDRIDSFSILHFILNFSTFLLTSPSRQVPAAPAHEFTHPVMKAVGDRTLVLLPLSDDQGWRKNKEEKQNGSNFYEAAADQQIPTSAKISDQIIWNPKMATTSSPAVSIYIIDLRRL